MKAPVLIAGILLSAIALPATAQKSALEHVQFDGVSSDGELKVEGHTRRYWLDHHPVQAKAYWRAWDCKGKPCDSTWNANIRKKAALIKRTEKDPPVQPEPKSKG